MIDAGDPRTIEVTKLVNEPTGNATGEASVEATREISDDRMLCYCKSVRYGEVREAIEATRATTVEQIIRHNSAGGGCRTCHNEIEELIAESVARRPRGGLLGFLSRLFSSSKKS